jgi:predicted amidophosphoribosyltransferase
LSTVPHVFFLDYLSDWSGEKTNETYRAHKIIKVAKTGTANGYLDFKGRRYDEQNWDDLYKLTVPMIGAQFASVLERSAYLVPIPNSDMTLHSGFDHRIIQTAGLFTQGYNSASLNAGQATVNLTLNPLLRWIQPKTPSSISGGFRHPGRWLSHLDVIDRVTGPIVLFDDVLTSGSQATAAIRVLKKNGMNVVAVFTLAKTCTESSVRPISLRRDKVET